MCESWVQFLTLKKKYVTRELKNLGSSMRKREGGTRMSAATEENTTESQYIGDKDLRLWEVQNSKR
jgi:hypothetical protein